METLGEKFSPVRVGEPRAATPQSPLGSGNIDESSSRKALEGLTVGDIKAPRADSISTMGSERQVRPFISKIGILPSSMPQYHNDYMAARKAGKEPTVPLPPLDQEDSQPHKQTIAEQVENVRRLKPHSRSQQKLEEGNRKPAGMTPVPVKKSKPTKWQFGIRSRNQPLEAIGCIYRALNKLGAEWELDENWRPNADRDGEEGNRCVTLR